MLEPSSPNLVPLQNPETIRNVDFPLFFLMFLESPLLATGSTIMAYSEPSWLHSGPILNPLKASLEPLWGRLGAILVPLALLSSTLGLPWQSKGAPKGLSCCRSCVSGISWPYLRSFCPLLSSSWNHLSDTLGPLEAFEPPKTLISLLFLCF